MTWFEASRDSGAVVHVGREEIWAVLSDPALVARLTPFVSSIEADGDHWRWDLTRIPGLGTSLAPSFTMAMTFEEPHRIDFRHDPPEGRRERAGVDGWYELQEVDSGTRVAISLTTRVDLPLTRLASPAVTTTMKAVLADMGRRFSTNLLRHLGTTAG